MKTETKKEEKCRVKLIVTLEAEEAAACVKDVERVFLRMAEVPGFRKGKVPLAIVRKEFAGQMKSETQQNIVRKYYAEAVKAEKIEEVALVGFEEVTYDDKGGSFTALVDVKPTFKLPTYKGLKVSENDTTVKDDAVKAQIENMRTAFAKFENAQEGDVIQDGDYVQIDYTGTVDGKPILEIAPDAKFVASGTGFWTQVEEGRFLPEILDALKGMKTGEAKTGIVAKFAKDAAPEGLKGKKASYDITVKAFRRRILPTDAEFIEKAKAESLEKLTETIRESMQKQAVEQESVRRENEAIELLMKKVDFDVPQSQVAQQTDGYLNELAQRAQYAGLTPEYFEKNKDKILKEAQENAEKQVRLWYVIDAIAKAEKIEGKPEELGRKVMEFILANAKK